MAVAEKVTTLHDPEITAKGSRYRHLVRVEVLLKDGTAMEETVESARGSEKRFASEAEVVEKFSKLARHGLDEAAANELRDCILNLEEVEDATTIARLLSRA